jgi:hypothetical protein
MVMHNGELLLVTFLVLIPSLFCLILYFWADGGLPDAVIAQSTVDNTYVFIACATSTTASYSWPTYVFVGYNLLLLLICAILFLLARNLQTAYDEAEFLFLCVHAWRFIDYFLDTGFHHSFGYAGSSLLHCGRSSRKCTADILTPITGRAICHDPDSCFDYIPQDECACCQDQVKTRT